MVQEDTTILSWLQSSNVTAVGWWLCLVCLWLDLEWQRTSTGLFSLWLLFKLASPSLPKTLFTSWLVWWGVVVIDCWPPFQFHFLSFSNATDPDTQSPSAACQPHRLMSSQITNGKPNTSPSVSRIILAACLSKSVLTYSGEFNCVALSDIWDFCNCFFSVWKQLCGLKYCKVSMVFHWAWSKRFVIKGLAYQGMYFGPLSLRTTINRSVSFSEENCLLWLDQYESGW